MLYFLSMREISFLFFFKEKKAPHDIFCLKVYCKSNIVMS